MLHTDHSYTFCAHSSFCDVLCVLWTVSDAVDGQAGYIVRPLSRILCGIATCDCAPPLYTIKRTPKTTDQRRIYGCWALAQRDGRWAMMCAVNKIVFHLINIARACAIVTATVQVVVADAADTIAGANTRDREMRELHARTRALDRRVEYNHHRHRSRRRRRHSTARLLRVRRVVHNIVYTAPHYSLCYLTVVPCKYVT